MFLKTSDGVNIAYDLYDVANPKGYIVLVHMMPATKESWQVFASKLQNAGYFSIAVDMRGHGQSDGGPDGYKNFTEEEHQKSILDINTAVEFLKLQGVKTENIYLAGASIGANLSFWYLRDHPEIAGTILFSPGLNYKGVLTERLAGKISPKQKVLMIASQDDKRSGGNAIDMAKKLKSLLPEKTIADLIIYKTGGHGTDLLEAHLKLSDKILQFLDLPRRSPESLS